MTLFKQEPLPTFVVLDVETTGLSPSQGDRVVEIAGLKTRGDRIVEEFHSLINPGRPLSPAAQAVNGITPAMVRKAPRIEGVWPEWIDFCRDAVLIGHNIYFDLSFLKSEGRYCGSKEAWDHPHMDTLKMARALIPEAGRFSLDSVAYFLDLEFQDRHRALGDVRLTWDVFRRLVEVAERRDIVFWDQMIHLFREPRLARHRGDDEKIALIERAIQESSRLRMTYWGAWAGQVSQRDVTPQSLVGSGARLTLVGYCHHRRAERHFLISRILKVTMAGDSDSQGEE